MSGLECGTASTLADSVRCLLAPNPGLMTGPGTNTYLLGSDRIAVIDPGPLIEEHLHAIRDAAGGTIEWILVTHTHPDHSPAAKALAEQTGAELIGVPAPIGPHQDRTFVPHRAPADGGSLDIPGIPLQAIHTPGHASNHVCYRHLALEWLFTGDHIINGSTVVIDPPDGNMAHYLQSLERLQETHFAALAPGHGELIEDPAAAFEWLIAHRLEREAKVIEKLRLHPATDFARLIGLVYDDVDPRLHRVAGRSLLAHLIKLEGEGRAWPSGNFWSLTD